ncbi:MAG TPA: DUF4197 domain-containing protein [Chitinophagaceae bacterium]|nr:DUF4197 domain-containing protein [Chitinophagaceae bacterium]
MKKTFVAIVLLTATIYQAEAQGIKGLMKKATGSSDTTNPATTAPTSGTIIGKVFNGRSGTGLTQEDVAEGLKQALSQGVNRGTSQLASVDGFLKNAAVKVLLPPELQQVEQSLRKLGMGNLVDDAITSMNRAAEDAAGQAAPIFINAIKQMTIQDGFAILKGSDTSATSYLRNKTTAPLTDAFRPVIQGSLEKVGATKYWTTMINAYNKVSFKKVNPDLAGYVTDKALYGVFYQVAQEEVNIRKNPVARTTDLLKKVFGGS